MDSDGPTLRAPCLRPTGAPAAGHDHRPASLTAAEAGSCVAVAEDCPQHGPENRPPLGHVPRPGWRRRRGRSTAAPLLSPAEAGRRAAHFVSRGLACRARSRAVAAQAA
jgi:hypothetical protein